MEIDGVTGDLPQPWAHDRYTIPSRLISMSMHDEYLMIALALEVHDFIPKSVFKEPKNRSIILKAL